MLRFCCAPKGTVRALAAAVALATPVVLTQTAAADHGSRDRFIQRASIGTLRLDGRSFCITSERAAASQIAGAFCRLGYDAWTDCDTVIVRTRRGCDPSFRWDGCDYQLCDSWRGDCLVLNLRRIERRPIVRTYTPVSVPRTIIIRHGEQSGGFCHTGCDVPCRPGVVTVRGGPRDDPAWGRRGYDDARTRHLDQGWGRRWDDSCDTGFRWNWTSRRR